MAKLDGIKVVNENTVEYNGFVYALVTDGGRVNDLIQCFEDDDWLIRGEFYHVYEVDGDGDMIFNEEEDCRFRDSDSSKWKVFRKSHAIINDKLTDAEGVVKIELPDGTKLEGTPSDLEKITRSMQKMQKEQQGQVGQATTVEMPDEAVEVESESNPVLERLQVGDYAKVIKEDPHSGKVGDIVKIFTDDETSQPFKCEDLQGNELRCPWFREYELVKATNEEILKAKQTLLKEGDFARIISNETTTEEFGSHEFEVGTIVKLHELDSRDDSFEIRYLNGDKPDAEWVHRKDLEPLTKEEAEHIAREAEEEKKAKAEREEKEAVRLKWAAIGREVGKIKKGDIVRTTSCDGSVNPVGTIGVAREDSTVGSCSTIALNGDSANWSRVELIVPVEQRFDTVG
ncbi:hypothetical protein PDQ79_32040 [Bacillus cereus]|nr:hypothetical protein [Bacillus cereus]